MKLCKPAFLILALAALAACGKPKAKEPVQVSAIPQKPEKAAAQLQQVFVAAEPEIKTVANVASEALKTADYEAAIHSLQTIKERGGLTVDQGIAVQNSMISLEAKLIAGMQAGDANAKRAYEQLKRSRKN
jgi:hypothetical protein